MSKLLDTIKSKPLLFGGLFFVFVLSGFAFYETNHLRMPDSDSVQIPTVTPSSQDQGEISPYGSGDETEEESRQEETVDKTSRKLYGSRIGVQDAVNIDTSDWKTEINTRIAFSFKYPSGSKITNEGNCYRVEYGLGFVIFLLPIEGDMRCGARTGVGVLPDNVDVTDRLTIQGKEYLAPGFRAIMDTKGEMFYKPETRYFYDFHHMFSADGDLGSCQKDCIKIGYGIYKETDAPLGKSEVDKTMDSLRAIVESLKYEN
jgi:hypothetical protein